MTYSVLGGQLNLTQSSLQVEVAFH